MTIFNKTYLEPFFVGLFEGAGSLHMCQTKMIKNQPLLRKSYAVAQIKLKHNHENVAMLKRIAAHFGGNVVYQTEAAKTYNQTLWVATSKKAICAVLEVFDLYPLLTSQKICQLKHVKACMNNTYWIYHLAHRDSKYQTQADLIQGWKTQWAAPRYLSPWLSGFFEAAGCFGTDDLCVYISQNNDWYLLNGIKKYFQSHHKLDLRRNRGNNRIDEHYVLSMSGKPVLQKVMNHFDAYPLLGFQKVSYLVLRQKLLGNYVS